MRDKSLFVKVGGDYQWTAEEMENLVDSIDEVTDDEVSVIAMPDDVEYLTSEQAQKFADQITDAIEKDV